MSAGLHNFEIEQGTTFTKDIVYKPGGVAANLTGYTATLIAKCNKQGTTKVLDLSTPTEIVLTPLTGTLTISLTAAETAALPSFKEAFYELVIINGTYKKRILEGKVTLSPGVL